MCQPPWAKPPLGSSSAPPGAWATPSRVRNSLITTRRIAPPGGPGPARGAGRGRWSGSEDPVPGRSSRSGSLQPRPVVLEEEPGDELAPALHVDLLEDRLEVVLHRVGGEVKPRRDRVGRQPLGHQLRDPALAVGETVGVGDEG